ncbi:hypothetical protein K9U34_06755 [Lawsonia intracellularis]|uniref:hypothetical protein n=1 Tax=Lawsonia intracellularis TaxID=29546 RepID=UPI0003008C1E|nr:hypothetical protein [Lawsonia intracellularis]MBZ3893290.1 hypothetical protein [Lawsonia intracellularis]UYH53704.1 hypothetical protein OCT60_07185 [Lawsonia intracellularis]
MDFEFSFRDIDKVVKDVEDMYEKDDTLSLDLLDYFPGVEEDEEDRDFEVLTEYDTD